VRAAQHAVSWEGQLQAVFGAFVVRSVTQLMPNVYVCGAAAVRTLVVDLLLWSGTAGSPLNCQTRTEHSKGAHLSVACQRA
jgi:hypothetical protein